MSDTREKKMVEIWPLPSRASYSSAGGRGTMATVKRDEWEEQCDPRTTGGGGREPRTLSEVREADELAEEQQMIREWNSCGTAGGVNKAGTSVEMNVRWLSATVLSPLDPLG